jgi:hypothetical protein
VLAHTGGVRALRAELVEAGRACGALRDAMPCEVVTRLLQGVPLAVFDAVLDGALDAAQGARVAALTALAVAGADPAQVDVHVTAALTASLPSDTGETP